MITTPLESAGPDKTNRRLISPEFMVAIVIIGIGILLAVASWQYISHRVWLKAKRAELANRPDVLQLIKDAAYATDRGLYYRNDGDSPKVRAYYQQAIDLTLKLIEKHPDNTDWIRDWGNREGFSGIMCEYYKDYAEPD